MGVSVTCVDQTAVHGFGAPEQLEPVLTAAGVVAVPIDWQTVQLVWNGLTGYPATACYRDYHHRTTHDLRPWNIGGGPYRPADAAEQARAHARDFVSRCIERLDAHAADRGRPGLLCFALDTELLGHWWYEGQQWLRAVLAEAREQGLELTTVSEGVARTEPVERELHASSWGTAKDFSTWDSPKVADVAFAARSAELRTVAAAATGGGAPAALSRAARELMALQASDWAFQITGELSADYPRERLAGHAAELDAALGSLRDSRCRAAGPRPAQPGPRPRFGPAGRPLAMRVLILSWEYPPLIEGGLARHVRKLAENLVAQGVDVHVLARGTEDAPAEEEMEGVTVHRVLEPERPRELGEFVTWIERMNADMLAAGVEVGDEYDFDLVHGHDWLVAGAGDHLAKRFRCPFVVTIHATEYGRHQGWVDKHPQSHIHGVERWMANRADRVITCSAYMRDHVADIYGLEERDVNVIPNGIDPSELTEVDDLGALRARFAEPDEQLILLVGRLVYEKGFQLALEAMPGLVERLGNVRFLVAGLGHRRGGPQAPGVRARAGRPRHVPGLDRRRRAALALPRGRPDRGAVAVRAVRPGGAGGDGLGLPVHRGRHRRAARDRARRRPRRPALQRRRPRAPGDDGRAPAHRRRAARAAGGRGLRARARLRLGRRGRARRPRCTGTLRVRARVRRSAPALAILGLLALPGGAPAQEQRTRLAYAHDNRIYIDRRRGGGTQPAGGVGGARSAVRLLRPRVGARTARALAFVRVPRDNERSQVRIRAGGATRSLTPLRTRHGRRRARRSRRTGGRSRSCARGPPARTMRSPRSPPCPRPAAR